MRTPAIPATRGLAWVVVLALCLSCLAWWPMLTGYPHTQIHDGPFFHKMLEVARISVTRYHELPLWNPFECGGVPLWDNPQGIGAAPLLWVTLLVGSTRAIEIWYVLHSATGVVCMWLLARGELRLSPAASMVAAASWAFAGVHNQHFTGGHVVWACYMYFPLAILFWRRAEHDLRAAVGLGLIAALTIYEGGTYPLPYLAVLLGFETLFRLWPIRRLIPITRAAVVVVVVAFTVGAARFLPVLDQLAHHHRDIPPDTDSMKWENLKNVFLARDHARAADGQQYVWPEFGDYLGPFVLGLAAVGVFTLGASELWLLALFCFSFALMCGHFASYAPWSLLNTYVYPFKQMRVPSRFVALTTLFLSVFAGLAVDRVPRLLRFSRPRSARACASLFIALGLVGVGDEISVGTTWAVQAFQGAPQDLKQTPALRFHYGNPWTTAFLDTPSANAADLGCWEEWAFERDAALWLGDLPQARTTSRGVKVVLVDRTTNTFTIDVEAASEGRIQMNSTYDRGWRSDVGTVAEANKMLAVDVPAGTYTVHLKYWPHGLTAGLWISALGLLAIALFFTRGLVLRARARRATFAG